MALKVGDKLPNVTLVNTRREAVSLQDLGRGKKLVVAFYPGAFTSVCTRELCTFRDRLAEFNGLDAQIVAISVDGPFANAAYAEQNKLEYPVLSDYNREAVKAFDVAIPDFIGLKGYTAANRAVFVADGTGTIQYVWVGPNPGVEPDYDEVKKAAASIK
jgi:peroxiredoxin